MSPAKLTGVMAEVFLVGVLGSGAGLAYRTQAAQADKAPEKSAGGGKEARQGKEALDLKRAREFRVFNLPKATKAEEAATALRQLFEPSEVRIAAYPSKNLLLVRGASIDLDTVEAIIQKLLDPPPAPGK